MALHEQGKWIGVCGGVASDPQAVPILVGVGVDELSCSIPAIPAIKANISGLTHCATRLRFQLRDSADVDISTIESIKGVMGGVPRAGNRYQIIIGGGVQNVYNDIVALPKLQNIGQPSDTDVKAAARAGGPRGNVAWLDNFFEFLSDSFRPILGALLGASLFHVHVVDVDAGDHRQLGRPTHRAAAVVAAREPHVADGFRVPAAHGGLTPARASPTSCA